MRCTNIDILFSSSSETNKDSEDVSTHDVQSQTELSLDTEECNFEATPENDTAESNLVYFKDEALLRSTLSLEPHREPSDENEPSFDHCTLAVLPEPALYSQENSLVEQELYDSFHFWRTPLPKIDIDLELQENAGENDLANQKGQQEVMACASSNIMATRKELEEMIENLEPHIDDPDVKGK